MRTLPEKGLRLASRLAIAACGAALVLTASAAAGTELWIGAATADITPDEPVPLTGYRNVRISKGIHSRCQANVLALEARVGDRVVDPAIMIACDLCVIRPGIQEGFRKQVADRLPGFDINKLFLTATHTHTAPVLLQDRYQGYGDAMQPKEYVALLYERMADAVAAAWESRAVGAVGWGLGHAVVGCNRRSVFSFRRRPGRRLTSHYWWLTTHRKCDSENRGFVRTGPPRPNR